MDNISRKAEEIAVKGMYRLILENLWKRRDIRKLFKRINDIPKENRSR